MEIPNIYNFLDLKYQPFIRFVFTLPASEFYPFLESIKHKKSISREFHGFEIESNIIEFWDASNDFETQIKVNFNEFVDLITPLKNLIIGSSSPEQKEKFDLILKDISSIKNIL